MEKKLPWEKKIINKKIAIRLYELSLDDGVKLSKKKIFYFCFFLLLFWREIKWIVSCPVGLKRSIFDGFVSKILNSLFIDSIWSTYQHERILTWCQVNARWNEELKMLSSSCHLASTCQFLLMIFLFTMQIVILKDLRFFGWGFELKLEGLILFEGNWNQSYEF